MKLTARVPDLFIKSTQDMRGTSKSTQQKRRVTDKHGFLILIILLMLGIGYSALSDNLGITDLKVNDLLTPVAVNGSWMNRTFFKSTEEVIRSTTLWTLNTLTKDNSLIKSFIVKTLIGLSFLIPIRFFIRMLRYFLIILIKVPVSWISDYSHHFIIVSVGKITSTLTFLAIIHFYWSGSKAQYRYLTCIALSESTLLFYSIYLYIRRFPMVKNTMSSLNSTFSYYLDHRYLILFQLLNYSTMLFLMAYPAIKLYDFFPRFFPHGQAGMLFIIYLLHKYGEMVIILSKASHSRKRETEMVSLRTILSSMITISRCHIGTIIMNIPAMGFLFTFNSSLYLEANSKIMNRLCEYVSGTNTMKNLIMFTAIFGQDLSKAAKSIRYFERKNQIVTNFENKMSSVWTDVLIISLPVLVLMVYTEASLFTAEDFLTGISVLTLYVALIGSYYYVFVNTMNTVENTIEYCNMIKDEDIKLMHEEELHQEVQNSGEPCLIPSAGKINEEDKATESKTNLEILKDNDIV